LPRQSEPPFPGRTTSAAIAYGIVPRPFHEPHRGGEMSNFQDQAREAREGMRATVADANQRLQGAEAGVLQRLERGGQGSGELSEFMEFGAAVAASKFFHDAQNAAQAVVKLAIGRELGLSKTASLTQIYIFEAKGRTNVIVGAHLIAAKINASPAYRVKILETTAERCAILPHRRGGEFGAPDATEGDFVPVGPICRGADGKGCKGKTCPPCYGFGVLPVTYTLEDAKRAGLLGKDNWKNDPEAMNYSRAMAKTQRRYFPDLFAIGAVYVAEELEEIVPPLYNQGGEGAPAAPPVVVQRPRRASQEPPQDAVDAVTVPSTPPAEESTGGAPGPISHGRGCVLDENHAGDCIAEADPEPPPATAATAGPGGKTCPRNPKHKAFHGLFCPECQETGS
jgi:hypothetical protein